MVHTPNVVSNLSTFNRYCELSYYSPFLVKQKYFLLRDILNIKRDLSGIRDPLVIANIIHFQVTQSHEITDFKDDSIISQDQWYHEAVSHWKLIMASLIQNITKRSHLSDLIKICEEEIDCCRDLEENPKVSHKILKTTLVRYELIKRYRKIPASIDFLGDSP